ncbi:MAG: DUF308 domain-containing protein [Gammaproteobacteria bacterium]|nr:DUF308 domain-containing protein [Gammaproteobacteria bacterium]
MRNPVISGIQNFGRYNLIVGIILFLLGSLGIALPVVMSLTASIFVGWLMLFAGLFWLYYTYKFSQKHFLDWIKPVLLILISALILFDPLSGIVALALLLAVYLIVDAFSSVYMAYTMHPDYGWGWMTVNGIVTLLLAVLLLMGWPKSTPVIFGIFIGFSLIFDGWVLIMIWLRTRNLVD